MGTHPIFESDFDCLTDFNMLAGRQVVTQVRCSSGRLKELGVRLRSIKNIEKITKTMKMISSAKFAKSSKLIGPARAFGFGAQSIEASADNAQKELYIAITSDRGLCGALHTTIRREETHHRRRQGPHLLQLQGPGANVVGVQRTRPKRPNLRRRLLHRSTHPGKRIQLRRRNHQVQPFRLGDEASADERDASLCLVVELGRSVRL